MSGRIYRWMAACAMALLVACGGGPSAPNLGGTVTNVRATPEPGFIQVAWSYEGEADRFEIFRGLSSGTDVPQLELVQTVLDPDQRSYRDTNVQPDASYVYAVSVDGGAPVQAEGAAVQPAPGKRLRVLFATAIPAGANVTITSDPSGISCGAPGAPGCDASFSALADVTLEAAADGVVPAWEGCDTVDGTTCMVDMATDRTVTVSFGSPVVPGPDENVLDVRVEPAGTGVVTNVNDLGPNPAVACDDTCSYGYPDGLAIGLTAEPLDPSTHRFVSWSGDCAGSSCSVTMDGNRSVTAVFEPIPPRILSFDASPTQIQAGATATLEWEVSGGGDLAIRIEPSVGTVSSSTGTMDVAPSTTTTYTLVVSDGEWTDTASRTIRVAEEGDPPTIDGFWASDRYLDDHEKTRLYWVVSGEGDLEVTIEPGVGEVPDSGQRHVRPDATTTYTLRASNAFGTVEEQVVVYVDDDDDDDDDDDGDDDDDAVAAP